MDGQRNFQHGGQIKDAGILDCGRYLRKERI